MRGNTNSRIINVKKSELIAKIRENKEKHKADYLEAEAAYRAEAKKQLAEQKKRLDKGELDIRIQLTTPVNRETEYDKIIQTFEWEIKDEVELSQGEFNEYVLDEYDWAVAARFSNAMYKGKGF